MAQPKKVVTNVVTRQATLDAPAGAAAPADAARALSAWIRAHSG
jgi:hypothetical protein